MLFSCKKEDKDKTFKIIHLKPNRVYEATDTVGVYGWFSKRRNDFFVVKKIFDLELVNKSLNFKNFSKEIIPNVYVDIYENLDILSFLPILN